MSRSPRDGTEHRKRGIKVKFYTENRTTGNLERSFPPIKLDIEVVFQEDQRSVILPQINHICEDIANTGLSLIDTTSRNYLDSRGKVLNYLKKVFVLVD